MAGTMEEADKLHAQMQALHEAHVERRRSGETPDPAGLQVPDPLKHLNEQGKAIYGVDNRTDIHEVSNPKVLRNVAATAALIGADQMMHQADRWVMRTARFGDAYRLCSGQTFEDQPVGPHCSGFLVAEDIIATAGHCVKDDDGAKKTLFVFDFQMACDNTGTPRPRLTFEDDQVYTGASLIGRVYSKDGADWALVRLDRSVEGREPLPVRRSDRIANGHPVYVIGHPCGLPKKYAPDSRVKGNDASTHFEANLDTFGGNSGSPVFSAVDHKVEGILVRGQTDFWTTAAGCQIVSTFPTSGPRGEAVCRCTEFSKPLDESMLCPKPGTE